MAGDALRKPFHRGVRVASRSRDADEVNQLPGAKDRQAEHDCHRGTEEANRPLLHNRCCCLLPVAVRVDDDASCVFDAAQVRRRMRSRPPRPRRRSGLEVFRQERERIWPRARGGQRATATTRRPPSTRCARAAELEAAHRTAVGAHDGDSRLVDDQPFCFYRSAETGMVAVVTSKTQRARRDSNPQPSDP